MKLPNLLSSFYVFASKATPERFKSTTRGLYNSLVKLLKYGKLDIFAAVDIETVSLCNIKCSYCPNKYYDRGNHLMPEKLFKKIIDELAEIKYQGRISPHFYGEPLLDKRLADLMAYARKMLPKADIIIHTNGLLLTKELFFKLIQNGVDGFVITLHNQNIKNHLHHLFLQLSTEFWRKIRILNPDKLSFFNRGGTVSHSKIKKLKRCFYLSDEIAIDWQGNVVCTNDYFSKYSFGNINNEKLMAIWRKEEFKKIRKNVKRGKFELFLCKKCIGK